MVAAAKGYWPTNLQLQQAPRVPVADADIAQVAALSDEPPLVGTSCACKGRPGSLRATTIASTSMTLETE